MNEVLVALQSRLLLRRLAREGANANDRREREGGQPPSHGDLSLPVEEPSGPGPAAALPLQQVGEPASRIPPMRPCFDGKPTDPLTGAAEDAGPQTSTGRP